MTKEELIASLDLPVNFQMVAHLTAILQDSDPDITHLLDASFYPKKEVAFRAAWMLEYQMVHSPEKFSPYAERLVELLPGQCNASAMRHYSKIVALLTAPNAVPVYRELAGKIDFDRVIETFFSWLIDMKVPVATKVHAMQALINLVPRYQWIKDDLADTIDYLADLESIAFFARAKKVRKQLKKIV